MFKNLLDGAEQSFLNAWTAFLLPFCLPALSSESLSSPPTLFFWKFPFLSLITFWKINFVKLTRSFPPTRRGDGQFVSQIYFAKNWAKASNFFKMVFLRMVIYRPLIRFLSYVSSNFYAIKIEDYNGIWTRVALLKREHADHSTTIHFRVEDHYR